MGGINVEIQKVRDETLLKQSVFSNPGRDTKCLLSKFIEFARDRCMLRKVRVAGKQIASRANDRESKGPKGSIGSINFGAASGIFTSVHRLIKV